MKNHVYLFIFVMLTVAALACNLGQSNPNSEIATYVAQTANAAIQTQAALPSSTPVPPTITPLPSATPTIQQNAPNPLPASHTGFNMNNGECFDYDSGIMASAVNGDCDIWLAESGLLRQVNAAKTSGYVTISAPTLFDCQNTQFDPNDLAVQTDLYMCFESNQGHVGFIVARGYLGGIPFTGIVFDYWIFN